MATIWSPLTIGPLGTADREDAVHQVDRARADEGPLAGGGGVQLVELDGRSGRHAGDLGHQVRAREVRGQ